MITSRLVHITCGIGLWIGMQMMLASGSPTQAQISPPPESGSPSTTTGGGSRS